MRVALSNIINNIINVSYVYYIMLLFFSLCVARTKYFFFNVF